MFPKIFCRSILHLNRKHVQILRKVSNKIHFIKRLRQNCFVLTEENLSAEEIKEAEVLSWWNPNKKRYTHMARIARRYFLAPPSSVYSERLFSEAGNLYEQKRNQMPPKTGIKIYFFITTWKSKNILWICMKELKHLLNKSLFIL